MNDLWNRSCPKHMHVTVESSLWTSCTGKMAP
eukprot:CAMPEP_0198495360 /NCGR_PEP_ID=MMETSP1462-20131121/5158_1 /TAXON_ID=1333877 /ORGANISM="Brandtodinium nutriculum, Strain RCC3387" /LENGTH=31 /DNA_ID= /DNA_START= /DNA_END= /DNA_ORIENTATION=